MTQPRVALLIDGDNISAVHSQSILDAAHQHGDVVFSRVYVNQGCGSGNWVSKGLIDVFVTGMGGNSSDFRMSFDAVEMEIRDHHDVFMIVSNDSDLLHVIRWLKERGRTVVIGGTPEINKDLCNVVSDVHIFKHVKKEGVKSSVEIKPTLDMLTGLIAMAGGSMALSDFGQCVRDAYGFKSRAFGHRTWSRVFSSRPDLFAINDDTLAMTVSLVGHVNQPAEADVEPENTACP